ncbi:SDR family NAD(P)-dependent oxidoreductase [uncultured Sphingomonas sp.]|uniref:SDR family NAD(P)-dependent oxidoreductase n=1 Tax=uncultured Sphingomonas sp. TaxID=158754 RepID=UPI0035C96172
MTTRLDGRIALITGAGSGLGRQHALLFAALGARVVVNDLGGAVGGEGASTAAADTVVEEIRARGGEAVASHDSVTDIDGAGRMVARCIEAFGGLDIVVNNAGILRDRSFAKMTAEDFEAVVRVHLFGAFNVTHAAWPHMIERQYGRVILTTSAAGTNGNFGQVNYGAAKLGLVGMMNCLALEGARKNVHVNCISPAAITRMTESFDLGKLGDYMGPELVSPAVAWLASEDCAQSGLILTAIAGHYGNVRYVETPGVQFDPVVPVTPDMIAGAREQIEAMAGAKPVRPGPLGDIVDHLKAIARL